jgi:hypothetical protein
MVIKPYRKHEKIGLFIKVAVFIIWVNVALKFRKKFF